ncbi:MAG TPA: dihydrolipoamide acetyltransferase family protein [Candidatus Acidoferrales bacterium]|nr:dihydrolipoamide acetyltransferase family protein [Candidatus Acidoferrales bacterium]
MARAIVMPSMGMYTEEGVLAAWLRAAGSRVAAGEAVAEITTEKATFEIPAPEAGILFPAVPVGTNLKVEALMGYILADGEAVPDSTAAKTSQTPTNQGTARAGSLPQQEPVSAGPLRASPIAKRLAAQHGVDLQQVKGSGPSGRIVEADVLAVVSLREKVAVALPATPRIGKRVPMAGLRRALADGLRHTLSTAASTTLTREADAGTLVAARLRLGEKLGVAPSYDALFIKLFAAALRERPELNAIVEGETIVQLDEVHIGFAVATPSGLVVPVVHNADTAPFAEINRRVLELSNRVLGGRLQLADVGGGTATISNLGGQGIDAFTPILNGTQSVILGIGRIAERPVVRGGSLAIGHTCVLSLTFDHRVADGAPAALLLDAVVRRMNDEKFLAALGDK